MWSFARCQIKLSHGRGWSGLVLLDNVGALVLWFQLVFLAAISLNFQGSLGWASGADIL